MSSVPDPQHLPAKLCARPSPVPGFVPCTACATRRTPKPVFACSDVPRGAAAMHSGGSATQRRWRTCGRLTKWFLTWCRSSSAVRTSKSMFRMSVSWRLVAETGLPFAPRETLVAVSWPRLDRWRRLDCMVVSVDTYRRGTYAKITLRSGPGRHSSACKTYLRDALGHRARGVLHRSHSREAGKVADATAPHASTSHRGHNCWGVRTRPDHCRCGGPCVETRAAAERHRTWLGRAGSNECVPRSR